MKTIKKIRLQIVFILLLSMLVSTLNGISFSIAKVGTKIYRYLTVFILCILLSGLMLLSFNSDAQCKVKSGKWHNMSWKYNTKTKVLVVKGNGHMRYKGDLAETAGWRKKAREAKKIIFKGDFENVGKECFSYYSNLEEVVLPVSIKRISARAFWESTKLKKINLKKGLEIIESSAFACTGFKTITIPGTIRKIVGAPFLGCSKLKKIRFENGIKVLGVNALTGIDNLRVLKLPKSLRIIKGYAFSESKTGLKKITIPENVEEIDETPFWFMKKLKKVIIKSKKIKKWGKDVLEANNTHRITVEVPKTKYKEYKKIIMKNRGEQKVNLNYSRNSCFTKNRAMNL